MSESYCPRERDVLRAVARGWRDEDAAEVTNHVESCPRCTEVKAAAELLRAEHARLVQQAKVPPAAAMWWKLDRRIRHEDARRAQRIATAVQALVLAAGAGVAAAVIQIAAPWLRGTGTALQGWADLEPVAAFWSHALTTWSLPIAMLVGAWLILVPAAVYLGLADE